MNKILKYMLPCFLLLGIFACKKTDTVPASNVVYEETISDIKKNEPVLLTFNNSNNTTTKVIWSVSPTANTTISAVGNMATISFSMAGTYKVTATAGTVSAIYTVLVNNTDYTDYGTDFNLSASKQVNIEQNEPVVFYIHNSTGRFSQIAWKVSQGTPTIDKDTTNKTATITFPGSGIYTVTAIDGVHKQSRSVWVNDPATSNSEHDTVPFILGEKLRIRPSIITIAGVKQLVMEASTTNPYHCPTDKILSFPFSSTNNYSIDYLGVAIASQPCSPFSVATCSNSFASISVGSHNFTINFGNKTFTGSLNVSSGGIYTFTWPDESVVNISPLVVQ